MRHRLQAFSPAYFTGQDARLFSYSAENCRASHCGQAARAVPAAVPGRSLERARGRMAQVEVSALGEFFCNPAQVAGDAPAGAAAGGEGRGAGRGGAVRGGVAGGYAIRQELVELGAQGASAKEALRLMKASGRLPLGEAGARAVSAGCRPRCRRSWSGCGRTSARATSRPSRLTTRLGEFRLTGEIRRLTANGLAALPLREHQGEGPVAVVDPAPGAECRAARRAALRAPCWSAAMRC